MINLTSVDDGVEKVQYVELDFLRLPPTATLAYTLFYSGVFIAGLVGNSFVLLAVLSNTSLRSTTDYLIASLGAADLLIILFCLPTTMLNNLLTEWQLGPVGCKLSTWINATTSCASIFTLVAVTLDRYLAICHTFTHLSHWGRAQVFRIIAGIWILSSLLASPNLWIYDEVLFELDTPEGRLRAHICLSNGDDLVLLSFFIVVNITIAFLLPILLISTLYALIWRTISRHKSLAIDSRAREERVKLRVAHMMLTVIVCFMLCWTPLYSLYCYFYLADRDSQLFHFASSTLRPIFQWLSLLSSALNPLIYIAYSHKYRRAFHQLLLTPCRSRYRKLERLTRATLHLPTLPQSPTETPKGSVWRAHSMAMDATLNKWGRKVSLPLVAQKQSHQMNHERKCSEDSPPHRSPRSTKCCTTLGRNMSEKVAGERRELAPLAEQR